MRFTIRTRPRDTVDGYRFSSEAVSVNLSGRVTQAELRTENYGVDKLVGNVSTVGYGSPGVIDFSLNEVLLYLRTIFIG